MASHLICGQANYYITVSQLVFKKFVTLAVTFDLPTQYDTTTLIEVQISSRTIQQFWKEKILANLVARDLPKFSCPIFSFLEVGI